jgi:hypothetical protein
MAKILVLCWLEATERVGEWKALRFYGALTWCFCGPFVVSLWLVVDRQKRRAAAAFAAGSPLFDLSLLIVPSWR